MENPMNGTAPQVGQAVVYRLVIEWTPATGQFNLGVPQVDDTIKLGMLEMAKQVIAEMRGKTAKESSGLIVPARMAH